MARKRGCWKVGQHLSGTHFPVLVGHIKDSGWAEVGSGIRHELPAEVNPVERDQNHQKTLKDPQPISKKVQNNGLHLLNYLHEEWETWSQGNLPMKWYPYKAQVAPQDHGHLTGWSAQDPELVIPFPISFLFMGANIFPCQVFHLLTKLCKCFSFGPFWLSSLFFDQRHWGILGVPFYEGLTCDTYIKLSKALRYGSSHIPNKNVMGFIQNLALQI